MNDPSAESPDRVVAPPLGLTGERCIPWASDTQIVYEHLHRYFFAATLATGRRVLDLGSGEGYGSAILAQVATSVVGIELDDAVVQHASATYASPNLRFEKGSVLRLSSVSDRSIDLVVCFEVIEHIEEHEQLLEEIDRVLKHDGCLVISTPNRDSTRHTAGNPFHVRELNRGELEALLRGHFTSLRLWAQDVTMGSVLRSVSETLPNAGEPIDVIVRRYSNNRWRRELTLPPDDVVYLVAVAAKGAQTTLPSTSHLDDPDIIMFRHVENAALDRDDAKSLEIRHLRAQLAELGHRVYDAEFAVATWHQRWAHLQSSRIVRPALEARRVVATSRRRWLGVRTRLGRLRRRALSGRWTARR